MSNAVSYPRWLTSKQVRNEYSLTEKRLRQLRDQQKITFKVEGKRYLYSRESLDAYFDAGSVEAKPQIKYIERYTPIHRKEVNSSSNLKGGKTMPWIKETSKEDGRSNGRCRQNCGDFSLLETKNEKGKVFYYIDYREGDTRHTVSLKKLVGRPILDRNDAFEVARKMRNRTYEENKSSADKRETTFSEFAPEYLNLVKNQRGYRMKKNIIMGRLVPFFGTHRLVDLDFSKTSQYVDQLRQEGISDGTINLHLSVFRRILNVAPKFNHDVDARKIVSIRDFELERSERHRELKKEEAERLYAHANEFWKDLLTFALNTGLRLGNICHLKWTSVNFEAESITINGVESKNKRQFRIWMSPVVIELLKRKKQENGEHKFVFMRNGNGHSKELAERWVQYEFKNLTEKAGVNDLHFHDLRHTFGCRLVDKGIDLLTIKEAMAHKSIASTLCYVRPNEGRVKNAFHSLDQDYWDNSGVEAIQSLDGVSDGVKQ